MAATLWLIAAMLSIFLPAKSQKIAGPFYCVNEGFFPRITDNDLISYTTDIKPLKNNYEDKRMYGKFNLKKTIKKLRVSSTVYKESGNSWLRRGMPLTYDNLCKLPISVDNIKKSFSGVWQGDPCTLEAGQYTLKNWTFEEDLRKIVGNQMFYGHYKFEVILGGVVEDAKGEKEMELPWDLRLWVKDESERNSRVGHGKGGNKQKG